MSDKQTIKAFLKMCQESCHPDAYDDATSVCEVLVSTRYDLRAETLPSILEEMLTEDIQESGD